VARQLRARAQQGEGPRLTTPKPRRWPVPKPRATLAEARARRTCEQRLTAYQGALHFLRWCLTPPTGCQSPRVSTATKKPTLVLASDELAQLCAQPGLVEPAGAAVRSTWSPRCGTSPPPRTPCRTQPARDHNPRASQGGGRRPPVPVHPLPRPITIDERRAGSSRHRPGRDSALDARKPSRGPSPGSPRRSQQKGWHRTRGRWVNRSLRSQRKSGILSDETGSAQRRHYQLDIGAS
jgi:hypothetical protein